MTVISELLRDQNDDKKKEMTLKRRFALSTKIGNGRTKLRNEMYKEISHSENIINVAYELADEDDDGFLDLAELLEAVKMWIKWMPPDSLAQRKTLDLSSRPTEADVPVCRSRSTVSKASMVKPQGNAVFFGTRFALFYKPANGGETVEQVKAKVTKAIDQVGLKLADGQKANPRQKSATGTTWDADAEAPPRPATTTDNLASAAAEAEEGVWLFYDFQKNERPRGSSAQDGSAPNGPDELSVVPPPLESVDEVMEKVKQLAKVVQSLIVSPGIVARSDVTVNVTDVDMGEDRKEDIEENWELFSHFVTPDQDGRVTKQEFEKILMIWLMAMRYKDDWNERLKIKGHAVDGKRVALKNSQVLDLLRYVDFGTDTARSVVGQLEADRVLEIIDEFAMSFYEKQMAVRLGVATWVLDAKSRDGLMRDKLVQRLKLESFFDLGCFRFFYLGLMFAVIATSLALSNRNTNALDIQENMSTLYHLDTVADLTTLEDVKQYLTTFSKASASLAPLSQNYWSNAGEISLLSSLEEFSAPVPMQEIDFYIGRSFTMQAWVSVDQWTAKRLPKAGLPIVRKIDGDVDSEYSCWSWNFPPALAYGSHDYGGHEPSNVTDLYEDFASVPYDTDRESHSLMMHTMVVNTTLDAQGRLNSSVVSFYAGANLLGAVSLDRPVTDCISRNVMLGSEGLTLAGVNFIPRAYSSSEVNETFWLGTLLSDLGYGLQKKDYSRLPGVDALKQELNYEAVNERTVETLKQQVESSASLSALAEINPKSQAKFGLSNGLMLNTSTTNDALLTIPVTLIFGAPVYVNGKSNNFLPGDALPRRRVADNTGFAISAWVRFTNGNGGYLIAQSMKAWDKTLQKLQWRGYDDMCWFAYVGGDYTEFRFRSSAAGTPYFAKLRVHDLASTVPAETQFRSKSFRHFLFQVDPASSTPLKVCIDSTCSGPEWSLDDSESAGVPVGCMDSSYLSDTSNYPASERQRAINESQYWINQRPPGGPGAWPFVGDIMNFKVYHRALSDAEIKRVFLEDPDPESPNGEPIKVTRGCTEFNEVQDDRDFKDEFGHDCFWYYLTQQKGMQNCERNLDAQRYCQVACQSREFCWGQQDRAMEFIQIWPQQMEFRSTGSWGTTCVAKSTTAAKEAITCALNAGNASVDCRAYEHQFERLVDCLGKTVWRGLGRENEYMPCVEIIRTHVPSCDWDDSGLDAVANASNSTGEWSALFWIEPQSSTKCLHPQMRFLDGDGLPFSQLVGYDKVVLDPPLGNGCNDDNILANYLYGKAPHYKRLNSADLTLNAKQTPGVKHLVVFGRKGNKAILHFDSMSDEDDVSGSGGPADIKPNRNFLRVINIQGNLRVSPIRLSSQFLSKGAIAQIRYKELSMQSRKRGPAQPLKEQMQSSINRDVQPFKEKSFLIAPPLLIQARRKGAQECEWDFSSQVVQDFVRLAEGQRCSEPYSCNEYTAKNVYECPLKETDTDWFFGLKTASFFGGTLKGYAEFLSVIADHSVIVRPSTDSDSKLLIHNTENFLDSLTQTVVLTSIYYSVEFGITTYLMVTFHTTSGRVRGDYRLEHFTAITGDALYMFWFAMGVVIVLLLCMAIDNSLATRRAYQKLKRGRNEEETTERGSDSLVSLTQITRVTAGVQRETQGFWTMLTVHDELGEAAHEVLMQAGRDILLLLGGLVFVGLVIDDKTQSGPRTETMVGQLVGVPWDSRDPTDNKKKLFENQMVLLTDRIAHSGNIEFFGMFVTLAIFLRLLVATSAHPRIAHITSTLQHSVSDMVHFFVVFIVVMAGFASIASWRFGSKREDLNGVRRALQTLFDSVLDPPGSLTISDTDDMELVFLCVLIHVINFFFLMNFFLAIVLRGYELMVREIEVCTVEQDIMRDYYYLVKLNYLHVRFLMPMTQKIVKKLEHEYKDDVYISRDLVERVFKECTEEENTDLNNMNSTGSFIGIYRRFRHLVRRIRPQENDKNAANAWFNFYSNFNFLQHHHIQREKTQDMQDLSNKVDMLNTKMVASNTKLMRIVEDLAKNRKGISQVSKSLGQYTLQPSLERASSSNLQATSPRRVSSGSPTVVQTSFKV